MDRGGSGELIPVANSRRCSTQCVAARRRRPHLAAYGAGRDETAEMGLAWASANPSPSRSNTPPSSSPSPRRRHLLPAPPDPHLLPVPTYSGFQVAWLRLSASPNVALHIIERDPTIAAAAVSQRAEGVQLSQLPRRHHLAFSVSDFNGFLTGLRTNGTELFEKTQLDGRTCEDFFFDPDGQ
ncbi:hypothetical protein ZWY2020_028046 [Hordeum vulgare]|nr:hypothetical protein ZWY2020_028046 [Hordeum vulgare]